MFPTTTLGMEVDVQMPISDQLAAVLEGVFEHIWRSPSQLASLSPAAPAPPPVPFLGRVDRARILTLGVSPGAAIAGRGRFPEQVSSAGLARLLLDYFQASGARLAGELGTWERVLNELGCSYLDGSAAHVYLTPRAVRSLHHSEHYLFKELCRYDAAALLRLLAVLRQPRVLLMAGNVTPGRPVNTFLKELAAEHQWQFLGHGRGKDCFAYHSLMSEASCYDVFYADACPDDPGDPGGSDGLLHGIREQAHVIGLLATSLAGIP